MADETFRPERRPITSSEAGHSPAETETKLNQMANIRSMANNADDDGPSENIQITGSMPPALMAARQAIKDKAQDENPEANQKGPRRRESKANEYSTPAQKGNNLVDKLIAGIHNNSTLDYEKIILPSFGKFYDDSDGPSDGVLHIRPMTGAEEQILATQRFVKRGQAINMIFNKCLQEKYDSGKFLTQDRTYLLIYLRGISYSHKYEVEVGCPFCQKKFVTDINLNDLLTDYCPNDFGPQSLEDTLPKTGYRFKYRLSNGDDEQVVQAYRDRKARGFDTTGQPDDTLLYRTSIMIQDIEGVTEKNDLQKLLKELPIADVAYLRNVVNEPPFGVDTKVEISCASCSQDFEIDMPLEASFFFPRGKKKPQQ